MCICIVFLGVEGNSLVLGSDEDGWWGGGCDSWGSRWWWRMWGYGEELVFGIRVFSVSFEEGLFDWCC